ncbi:hypothetical protein [Methanobrevibacter sp.]|uniref:hypothetical protein n=1 Tax=Methanobrevibacter sp. TaxID=66852 RepID=UPI003890E301
MDKKSLILLIVCIIVFSFVVLTYAGIINQEETLQVGEINFKLPEGYKFAGYTEQGYPKITNGLDSIYFEYYNDTDISKHVKNFTDYCKTKNRNVTLSNFTTGDVTVYKTVTSDHRNNYWFVNGDKTYTFFTWKETFNVDDLANYLIDSSI